MHSYAKLCLAKKRNPNKCTVRVYSLLVLCHYLPNSADTGTHIGPNHLVLLDVNFRNYIELVYNIRLHYLRAYLL